MDLSICIVSWNCREDLLNCLESLEAGVGSLSSEVIVVDNASSDGTVEAVSRRFPNVDIIPNGENRGFAAANVQAMHVSRGRYILMLNPDTLAPPDALAQLVNFADAHPQAGVVGPKLVYGDGRLQHSCRCFPTIEAALFRNTILGSLFPRARASACYLMEDWAHDEVRAVDWLSGACMLIRRDAYEQVGDLDTEFYWGSEDVDYCRRMHDAGRQVLYTPEPAITHLVGRSTDKAPIRTIVRHHRSMYQLYAKHVARSSAGRVAVWCGVWLRAVLLIAQQVVAQAAGRIRKRLRKRRAGAAGETA